MANGRGARLQGLRFVRVATEPRANARRARVGQGQGRQRGELGHRPRAGQRSDRHVVPQVAGPGRFGLAADEHFAAIPSAPAVGNLPRPRIEYVGGKDITVDYTIQKAGRSGVKSASLFVQKDSGAVGVRAAVRHFDPPADTGKTLSLKYAAEKEGLYGFYVAPESGAGREGRAAATRRSAHALRRGRFAETRS